MQYKVPQDVQREDKILFFITLRQLIMLIVGGGISYVLYVQMAKAYVLGSVEIALISLPAVIAVGFAFVKFKGLSLIKLVFLMLEQFMFRPMRRYWIQGAGEPFTSSTMTFAETKKKEEVKEEEKNYSEEKVKALAALLDGEKPHIAQKTQS